MTKHVAEVGYSKDQRRLELVVPFGTKLADLADIIVVVFGGGRIGGLGRPCQTCTSGDHLMIRERLEHVIEVDLDKKPKSVT